jgi:hypothetical protein
LKLLCSFNFLQSHFVSVHFTIVFQLRTCLPNAILPSRFLIKTL